mmetsp:Transcript_13908/g.20528  ORF Transcript_13908/g.20528 Transcript_13908/m.20528 type:complete len:426 (+) Transcript_13908:102-1379(+)
MAQFSSKRRPRRQLPRRVLRQRSGNTFAVWQCLMALLVFAIVFNALFFSWLQDYHGVSTERTKLLSTLRSKFRRETSADDVGRGETSADVISDIVTPDRLPFQFAEAHINVTEEQLKALPPWKQVQDFVVGHNGPIIYGKDSCEAFRTAIPGVERNIGCSGMFNTGTNLVTQLLKENCLIPERVEAYGMEGPFHDPQGKPIGPGEAHGIRWQVPWGKHVPAQYRTLHATKYATQIWKESVLAVVTIRHPYDWMRSMCKNHYTAYWPHNEHGMCPHLFNPKKKELVPVEIKYDGSKVQHTSLADLWNTWYQDYILNSSFPFLVVRFEDLQFYAKNVTTQICHCAGGLIRDDRPFTYIINSAKQGPGHGKQEERTGMVDAWIKYGQPMPPQNGFNDADYETAKQELDASIMQRFKYRHPDPLSQDSK